MEIPLRKYGIAFAYTFTVIKADLLLQENEIFMKFDMTKAHIIDIRHGLPLSMPDSPHGNLTTLFQGLFKIFSHEEKSSHIDNEKEPVELASNVMDKKDIETRSLQQLEVCANAARKTEAYDQYQLINKSDEQK